MKVVSIIVMIYAFFVEKMKMYTDLINGVNVTLINLASGPTRMRTYGVVVTFLLLWIVGRRSMVLPSFPHENLDVSQTL